MILSNTFYILLVMVLVATLRITLHKKITWDISHFIFRNKIDKILVKWLKVTVIIQNDNNNFDDITTNYVPISLVKIVGRSSGRPGEALD